MILDALASKLANVFQKHCTSPQDAIAEAKPIIDDIYKSLGGCEICYGKGYKLIGDNWDYCECDRGKGLKGFIEGRDDNPDNNS